MAAGSCSTCWVNGVNPDGLHSQQGTQSSLFKHFNYMLKFEVESWFRYFPLQPSLDYPSCHAAQETPDLCEGTNLSEFTKTEGGSALVWQQFLRALISWSLNQIRALRLCLLLADNLITFFLLSFLLVIAISLLLTFTPSTSPALFCSPLSPWPLPFASISLLFLPTPTFSSGSVGHNDSAGGTRLEDISCQWGEWNDHFLLSVKVVILMNTTQNKWRRDLNQV